MNVPPAQKRRKLTRTNPSDTLRSRLRRARKVQDRFVRNLARNCPDLLADYRQVLDAHNAVIEAVVGELKKEQTRSAPAE